MSSDRRPPGGGLIAAALAGLVLRAGAPRGRGEPPVSAGAGRSERGAGHETRDVRAGATALAMAGLALVAVTAVGTRNARMSTFAADQRRELPALTPQQTTHLAPPPPNLQADPYRDLDREQAAARADAAGYAYLDAGRTRARIPIARAMELSVGRSLEPADGAADPHPARPDR